MFRNMLFGLLVLIVLVMVIMTVAMFEAGPILGLASTIGTLATIKVGMEMIDQAAPKSENQMPMRSGTFKTAVR